MTAPAASRCRVCAAEVPGGAPRCPTCGAAQGPFDPCPHCRAEAGVSQNHELRWVCDVCGGPRIPRLDRSITYSGREIPLLRKANAARKARAGWRAAAIASGMLLPLVVVVVGALLLIFGVRFALLAVALLATAPVGGFLAWALTRAAAWGHAIAPAIDAAWLSAATDVAQQTPGGVSVAALAQKLGIDEPQAEELMALVDVNEMIAPAPRARIAAAGAAPAAPTQVSARSAAEEEAALLEQAAAEVDLQRQKGSL